LKKKIIVSSECAYDKSLSRHLGYTAPPSCTDFTNQTVGRILTIAVMSRLQSIYIKNHRISQGRRFAKSLGGGQTMIKTTLYIVPLIYYRKSLGSGEGGGTQLPSPKRPKRRLWDLSCYTCFVRRVEGVGNYQRLATFGTHGLSTESQWVSNINYAVSC